MCVKRPDGRPAASRGRSPPVPDPSDTVRLRFISSADDVSIYSYGKVYSLRHFFGVSFLSLKPFAGRLSSSRIADALRRPCIENESASSDSSGPEAGQFGANAKGKPRANLTRVAGFVTTALTPGALVPVLRSNYCRRRSIRLPFAGTLTFSSLFSRLFSLGRSSGQFIETHVRGNLFVHECAASRHLQRPLTLQREEY